jgi:hypothetical protein
MKATTVSLALVSALCLPCFVRAGNPQAAQNAPKPAQQKLAQPGSAAYENDLAQFDTFLDYHARNRADLMNNPKLIDDQSYLAKYPELGEYLQKMPNVRQEIRSNPQGFITHERTYQRQRDPNGVIKIEKLEFEKYLQGNEKTREELLKDPKLIGDNDYIKKHPNLALFLYNHPGLQEEVLRHPQDFFGEFEKQ